MIGLPSETRVWLAGGATDMRRGFDGLALLVQETLKRDPHCGHLFVFRGKRGGLIKVLWHDGQGMCLLAKRLERGPLRVAAHCGRGGDDHGGTAGLPAGGYRLAAAAADRSAAGGRLMQRNDAASRLGRSDGCCAGVGR